MSEAIKLIECPRDAWQGLQEFIPTEHKVAYLRGLILAGFAHIDAVSFVSPKHVKQMADSEAVMSTLLASLPDSSALPEITVRRPAAPEAAAASRAICPVPSRL